MKYKRNLYFNKMNKYKFPKRNHIQRYEGKKCYLDKEKKYQQKKGLKPQGYWYSLGGSWFEFWGDFKEDNFVCEVIISPESFTDSKSNGINKILIVKDLDDIKKINRIYGKIVKDYKQKQLRVIEWKKFCKKYGGIEFRNYRKLREEIHNSKTLKKHRDYSWYSTIDAEGGCIWNLSLIDVNKIRKIKDMI